MVPDKRRHTFSGMNVGQVPLPSPLCWSRRGLAQRGRGTCPARSLHAPLGPVWCCEVDLHPSHPQPSYPEQHHALAVPFQQSSSHFLVQVGACHKATCRSDCPGEGGNGFTIQVLWFVCCFFFFFTPSAGLSPFPSWVSPVSTLTAQLYLCQHPRSRLGRLHSPCAL